MTQECIISRLNSFIREVPPPPPSPDYTGVRFNVLRATRPSFFAKMKTKHGFALACSIRISLLKPKTFRKLVIQIEKDNPPFDKLSGILNPFNILAWSLLMLFGGSTTKGSSPVNMAYILTPL